ncbi:hypothetical protein HZ326_10831 [Fusarium oxysporum f. sp. albedinis]|nr:hypothetical protein HZ326_10831 [Fusarium oxysporum f. sp. albedinis]
MLPYETDHKVRLVASHVEGKLIPPAPNDPGLSTLGTEANTQKFVHVSEGVPYGGRQRSRCLAETTQQYN